LAGKAARVSRALAQRPSGRTKTHRKAKAPKVHQCHCSDPEAGGTIAGYHPMGGMQRLLLQNGTLTQRWNYNEQGQTQLLGMYKTPSAGPNETLMKLTLGYGTATENNGNVRSQAITVGSFAASQSYDYDRWSRLKVAQEGSNWRQEFGYDRWGHRWMVTACTSGIPIPTRISAATNPLPDNSNELDGALRQYEMFFES
jgi:hypothetical protein